MGDAFAHPEWLTLVEGVVICAAFTLAVVHLERRARMRRLLGHPRVGFAGDAALLVALAAIGIGLAGPRLATRTVVVSSSGVDVVMLVDTSRSMDCQDVAPSRLARARRAAGESLARLAPGDRAALAAFAGRGVLLTPLTPDRDALAEMLPALDSSLIHPGGSNLPAGLAAALDAFEPESARPRVVVLLADGESSAGDLDEAAASLRRAEVRLVAGLLGTDEGGTIPDHGDVLRDEQGEQVVTRRHGSRLRELAQATGGQVLEGDRWGELDLSGLVRAVRADAGQAPGELVEREIVTATALPFAGVALALLALEALLGGGRAGRERPTRGRWPPPGSESSHELPPAPARVRSPMPRRGIRAAKAGLLLVLLVPSTLRGDGAEPASAALDGRTWLHEGLDHHAAGRWPEARRAFGTAAILARDPAIAAVAYHDLGVVALAQRDFEAARGAFFDSLALAPGRPETRYNLEWTLLALQREQRERDEPRLLDDPFPDEAAPGSEASEQTAPQPTPETEPTDGDDPVDGERRNDLTSPEPAEDDKERDGRPGESDETISAAESASALEAHAPLEPEQRERWLERIEDDPGAALRSVTAPRPGDPGGSFGARPRW